MKRTTILFLCLAAFSPFANLVHATVFAATRQAEIRDLQRLTYNLNRVSPLETAAAHSIYRVNVGAGVRVISLAGLEPELIDQEYQPDGAEQDGLALPQAWLSTSLLYPLDLGVIMGSLGQSHLKQNSAYLQWTWYEAFAMPALATRLTYGRSFGIPNTEISSLGIQALASWGYKVVTVYGGLSLDHHRFAFHELEATDYAAATLDVSQFYGLHLQFVPAFLYGVGEVQIARQGERTLQAKLCLDL